MTNPDQKEAQQPVLPAIFSIKLGSWNFYFITKLVLFWRELIGLHPLENLGFLTFLLMPLDSVRVRRARRIIAVPAGIVLFYYDSWLPPISRVFSQAGLVASFTPAYMLELLERFFNWPVVALLIIAWFLFRIVEQHVRLGVVVFVILLGQAIAVPLQRHESMPLSQAQALVTGQTGNISAVLDKELSVFHAQEAQRKVQLPKVYREAVPFDIVFIHVCSLSWDDLQATGLDTHSLWQEFDFVLRNFNSATGYSGPAAIRVNRALCGQSAHQALYDPAQEGCYLMDNLRQAGFSTNLLMNHDGHFDDFLELVQRQNFHAAPMPINGLPAPIHAFDDSPIYDDLSVLTRWMDVRQKSSEPHVAAYYNTVTLHDGNHVLSAPKLSSQETYKQRLAKFLDDLDGFIQHLAQNGRRTIVVVIPEHGAAFRGDKRQIPGLREIPSPAITLVPVGIKVIGPGVHRLGGTVQIDEPTSYLAVSQIISRMIEIPPFDESGFTAADYIAELPETEFVSESEDSIIMRHEGQYYLKQKNDDSWQPYEVSAMPAIQQ